jgi:hypothetical protein
MAKLPRSLRDFETVGIGTALKRNFLAVPLNQRDYAWEERHVQDLFQDLANAIDSGKQAYFLGTIVLTTRDDGTLEITDGQQRLATTTILLAAFRDYFMEKKDSDMVKDLQDFLYAFVRSTREISPKLQLNVTDNNYFVQRVLKQEESNPSYHPSSKPPSHVLIDDAVRLAQAHLENILLPFSESNRGYHLNRWIDFIENAAEVILVKVADDVNAYVMFETLNDRGLRVSQSDLVKNYLFRETNSRIEEAQQKWATMNGALEAVDDEEIAITFLRHLLISLHGHIREREVLEKVKERVRGRAPALEFLDTLSSAASDYVALLTPTHHKWLDSGLGMREQVRILLLLRVTPLRPLMLAVARTFLASEAEVAFRHFVFWSVRLLIAGDARSGRVEQALAEAARKVSAGEIRTAKELTAELRRVLPDDFAFQSAFSRATVANHRWARYYLRTLERVQQSKPEPEWVPNEETVITLEHVLPENPGVNWPEIQPAVHSAYYRRLGNMVLLPETPNRNIGNDSFDDKKLSYQQSSYVLTREVGESMQWDPIDIEQRQERLASLAVKAWPVSIVS